MYALGLDPNTKETGWVIVRTNFYNNDLYESGVIAPTAEEDSDLRPWESMAIAVLFKVMNFMTYDFVAIEDVYQGDNPQTTIKLAKLVGAISSACLLDNVPCYHLSTASIDRSLGILGDRKRGTKALGELILGKGKTQHEYDAWAALMAGMGVHKTKTWEKAGEV